MVESIVSYLKFCHNNLDTLKCFTVKVSFAVNTIRPLCTLRLCSVNDCGPSVVKKVIDKG